MFKKTGSINCYCHFEVTVPPPPPLPPLFSSCSAPEVQTDPWCLSGGPPQRRPIIPLCSQVLDTSPLVLGWSMEGCSVTLKEHLRTKLWTLSHSVSVYRAGEPHQPGRAAWIKETQGAHKRWCFPPDKPAATPPAKRFIFTHYTFTLIFKTTKVRVHDRTFCLVLLVTMVNWTWTHWCGPGLHLFIPSFSFFLFFNNC